MRILRSAFVAGSLALLVSCASPGITDMNADAVTVQINSGNDQAVLEEAQRGCSIYGKSPVRMSDLCHGAYCSIETRLFACLGPNSVTNASQGAPQQTKALTCYLPNGSSIQTDSDGCLQVGGGTRPAAAPPPVGTQPLGPTSQASPAPAAGPEEMTIDLRQAAAAPAASGPCGPFASDAVSSIRCEWVTGPSRDQWVPAAGRGASLAKQVECLPLKDDARRYAACIGAGA